MKNKFRFEDHEFLTRQLYTPYFDNLYKNTPFIDRQMEIQGIDRIKGIFSFFEKLLDSNNTTYSTTTYVSR